MTLKSKLTLGLGFLFLIIIALIVFSSLYLGRLAQDARNILKDNYASVVYAGIRTEIKTNDEAITIMRSIDLLDKKFGTAVKSKDCGQGVAGSIGDAP
jgi:hypothetical protein